MCWEEIYWSHVLQTWSHVVAGNTTNSSAVPDFPTNLLTYRSIQTLKKSDLDFSSNLLTYGSVQTLKNPDLDFPTNLLAYVSVQTLKRPDLDFLTLIFIAEKSNQERGFPVKREQSFISVELAAMAVRTAILPVLLGVFIIGNYGSQIMAEQVYSQDYSEDCDNFHKESSGYLCNGAAKECQTFALYRAQEFFMSLENIGSLFNTSPATIASVSNLSVSNYSKSLEKDQAVLFPIDCKCAGKFSQANLTYTVKAEDTYLKIANQTLEGLTTCQAMREQNPTVGENDLETGMKLVAPLRCACPTRQQLDQGIEYLLSYIVDVEDDDDIITAKFKIRHQDFISANGLGESNPTIYPYTTLLIPLNDMKSMHQARCLV